MSTKSKQKTLNICHLMASAMEKHRLTIGEFAERIGISRTYASLLVNGHKKPSPKVVLAVERLLRTPSLTDLQASMESLPVQPIYSAVNSGALRVQSPSPLTSYARNKYEALSEQELKDTILRYAQELKRSKGASKAVPLNVLRDLVEALSYRA